MFYRHVKDPVATHRHGIPCKLWSNGHSKYIMPDIYPYIIEPILTDGDSHSLFREKSEHVGPAWE
jgi:hypothetical protein